MKLILLPNVLDESASIDCLPVAVGTAIRTIDGLIAESEKEGRRYLRKFLSHEEMAKKPIRLLNEHTPASELSSLIAPIKEGQCWGLISDAGLPCLADPGADLVWLAREEGIAVETFAGPSSIVFALQLSGFSGQRFAFHGYLPREQNVVEATLRDLEKRSKTEAMTQIFIEAPYRSAKILESILKVLHPSTRFCLAASLGSDKQRVISQRIGKWREQKIELGKEPAVFLFFA